jgi:hypothetical protein
MRKTYVASGGATTSLFFGSSSIPNSRKVPTTRCVRLSAALVLFLLVLTVPIVAQGPKRILETTQPPSDVDRSNSNWARDVCGGGTALSPGGARYEWTPRVAGYGQYGSVEGVSGWALDPHESHSDVPFTHPFGRVDCGYLLLPDAPFEGLLAPRNGEVPSDDEDRVQAKAEADSWKLPLGPGLLGVEQDRDLIPEAYRPRKQMGDRVAIFGRWIVDCGHDN